MPLEECECRQLILNKKVVIVDGELLISNRYIEPFQKIVKRNGNFKTEIHYLMYDSLNRYLTTEEQESLKGQKHRLRLGILYPNGKIKYFLVKKIAYISNKETQFWVKKGVD